MKIHWGVAIAIFYSTFVILMIVFVVTSRNVDHSLVMDDYYEEDLTYQSHLDKVANANALTQDLNIIEEAGMGDLQFQFPAQMETVTGEVWLYRASDTSRDLKIPIATNAQNLMTIPKADLLAGKWRVKVEWQGAGKSFYKEQELYIQ